MTDPLSLTPVRNSNMVMELEEEARGDAWKDIIPDLFEKIVTLTDSYDNYVRMRAVCRSWMSNLPSVPKHIRNPWFVMPPPPLEKEEETDDSRHGYTLCNLCDDEKLKFEIPGTQDVLFRGSSFGWIVMVGIDGGVRLFNPFTSDEYHLPPLYSFPYVLGFDADREEEYLRVPLEGDPFYDSCKNMQLSYLIKVVLSCSPDKGEECMAIAVFGELGYLGCCRLGDSCWRELRPGRGIYDAIFYKGEKMYAIDWLDNEVYEYYGMGEGVGSDRRLVAKPPLNIVGEGQNPVVKMYLVDAPSGLHLLIRFYSYDPKNKVIYEGMVNFIETSSFDVYKLTQKGDREEEEEGGWVKVGDLGGYVFLVGWNGSLCCSPLTFPQNKGNRIFFTEDDEETQWSNGIGGHDMGFFDMEDNSVTIMFHYLKDFNPPPVWLLHKGHPYCS